MLDKRCEELHVIHLSRCLDREWDLLALQLHVISIFARTSTRVIVMPGVGEEKGADDFSFAPFS